MIWNAKIIIALLLLAFCMSVTAANYTISGVISNQNSTETLISASVFDQNSRKGTVSNNYGFYSLTLPQGHVQLHFSYAGFASQIRSFSLQKDTTINLALSEFIELSELTVTASQKELGTQGSQMSAINVPVQLIKSVPTLFGESDVLKSLQLLPGVQAGTEGSSGFYVRGGGPDENLFLLDGVPVYNVNHIAGFFSVFNTDAIKNVTLYKGGFPARFGGRLSSVVDIRMNDGNSNKLHGNFSLGLISSKINLEGPVGKSKKTTFNLSARRSYFDLLTKPVLRLIKFEEGFRIDAGYYFYDLNAKITHKLSEKDKLFVSFYNGSDNIHSEINDSRSYDNNVTEQDKVNMNWNWGNSIGVVRWNRMLTNKLFVNTSGTFTQYNFKTFMGTEFNTLVINPAQATQQKYQLEYTSGITDYGFKTEFDYAPAPEHDIKFGTAYTHHIFKPGISVDKLKSETEVPTAQTDTVIGNNAINTNELMFYAEDNWSINSFLKANVGLHFASFFVQNTSYQSLQPRISMRALLTESLSVKAGFASMQQFVHLLAYNNFSLPNDLWVPATASVKPMKSVQYSVGTFYNYKNTIDFSVEAYFKTMINLIEYTDGASFFESSAGWERKIVSGDGRAYGLELLAQKTVGKTTGWIGYTWSKTERIFNRSDQKLNGGNPFPAKYDRRHDISLVVSHRFGAKFDLSGTIKYSSGNYVTLPLQNYKGFSEFDSKLPYFTRRNNYQLPDYFRVDAGCNFHKQLKYGQRTWNISIYNATNSMNPFYLFVRTNKYNDPITGLLVSKRTFNKITVFPIIPSVSYSYKF